MSSLIFYTQTDAAVVATDTLSVSSDGSPFCFCTKAGYIPHLKTIIAGTGAGGFSNQWLLHASTRMVVRGIHNLDFHTAKGLRDLWATYKKEYSLPDNSTTTIYQFGISEESGEVVSFAYRSSNNFQSEQLQFGTGVKPPCTVLEGNLLDIIPDMMAEQKKNESEKPPSERVYIGGEIIALVLTKEGCNHIKLGEFEDFVSDEKSIFKNFSKMNN
ncbi:MULTISPECIES: hypothetical protein [Vibrio harveyi group]|uniref:hypothetical protein n=1 Tax=Vibrio harveyi group TaxID=717610 RepID=UPI0006A6CFB3|nr:MULTISPECIES: hypothetical protein [Vibrio harveyi group]MEA3480407.1 hypothetical protein [Pseudomonadota bacterium]KON57599.1 hypothetical protein ACX11_12295 [Vibrio parahaemolyticus]MBT0067001.1 hypothetical protein [Vibrio alginolyticus]MCX8755918.1 hypothetical protein [Vibrio parahaemolyticus]HCG8192241.1 hypothetical protein [Vibrio parahaemolyticus]